ncbi:beta-1,3-galactosyltransferase 2-like [Chanos chanos]|uniref:Hexosyltransferase n=1 Tax=Chanos chanos TaxID=29144 RepID=A0A6J2VI76_CHACN|nr:beta-1,3-galactosyltransferase 2-like [Chanos chanos]
MQWRRRHCWTHIAALISLLSFAGVLLFLRHHSTVWDWIGRRYNPVTYSTHGVQSSKMEANQSALLRYGWKEAGNSKGPLRPEVTSSLDKDSTQGLENSLGSNSSLSGEMTATRTQKVESYAYIINELYKCQQRDPFLVLLIAVEPQQVEARNAIRQTWGNETLVQGLGLARLFMLGLKEGSQGVRNSRLQRSIEAESRQHRDIIQQEFMDTYHNLTLKTLMGMHWVATHCPNARYVMKTDSDMFVNTEYLIQKLLKPSVPPRQNYFTGYLMRGYAPNRNKGSKWYMSPELYPSERYPVFCSGTGYVFSGDMAQKIHQASLSIRRLHLEDVYVGICLAKLRIEPVPPPNEFLFHHWRVSYSSCKYSQLITSHQFHPNELVKYWDHLQTNKQNACTNSNAKGHG